jgi:hypothetical protein
VLIIQHKNVPGIQEEVIQLMLNVEITLVKIMMQHSLHMKHVRKHQITYALQLELVVLLMQLVQHIPINQHVNLPQLLKNQRNVNGKVSHVDNKNVQI